MVFLGTAGDLDGDGYSAAVDQSIPNKRVPNCGTPNSTEDSGLGPLALTPGQAILPR
jgi:hypothetical protein